MDHTHVLVQCNEWVDCEQIADIACTSEAAHLQAEADKWQQEAEEAKEVKEVKEAKDCQVLEGERHPKKQGCADTAGSSIAVVSSSGGKKRWKVCADCTKYGKFPHFLFSVSRVDSS